MKIWRAIKRSCRVTDVPRPRENLVQMGDEGGRLLRGKREGISEILYCYQLEVLKYASSPSVCRKCMKKKGIMKLKKVV